MRKPTHRQSHLVDQRVRKFVSHYPNWKFRYGIHEILEEIFAAVAG